MNSTNLILAALTLMSASYWAASLWGLYQLRLLPRLADAPSGQTSVRPRVSIVIPARDEVQTLEAAVRSRLSPGYPELELILVNDRSQDGTGALVDRLAREGSRVRALHVRTLPTGWLGKVHALHVGTQAARGDWLLLTDADVHFAPGTVQRAVALCESRGREFASVLFRLTPTHFALDAVHSTFMRLIGLVGRLHRVEDPRSSAVMGAGVFNLVRREAFLRTPGFLPLRLAVADDVAFGQLMKRSGLRCGAGNALDDVEVKLYASVRAFLAGAEKNGFAVMGGFSQLRLASGCLVYALLECAPLLALLLPGLTTGVRTAGAVALLFSIFACLLAARALRRPVASTLAYPVGVALYLAAMVRSGWCAWRRGGILWRDTLYSTHELKAASRTLATASAVSPLNQPAYPAD